MNQLSELKFPFSVNKFPDPNYIVNTGDWYFLDHISSSLVRFEHEANKFIPAIAESWKITDTIYEFKISSSAKFNDGSPILAQDIEASVLRAINARALMHFPIWEYLIGCDSKGKFLKKCDGVEVLDNRTIRFILQEKKESFFLALSSPELGVWSKQDIDSGLLAEDKMLPTKFSGPYSVGSEDEGRFVLTRNEFSPLITDHPNAPKKIVSNKYATHSDKFQAFLDGKEDLVYGEYTPGSKFDWDQYDVKVHYTSPTTMLYLMKNTRQLAKAKVGQDLMNAFWNQKDDSKLISATSFLPTGSLGVLQAEDILSVLPATADKKIRISSPRYFTPQFNQKLIDLAKSAGVDLEVDVIDWNTFMSQLAASEGDDKWDYNLAMYVASERYPAVQLHYLLDGKKSPVDGIFEIDNLDNGQERKKLIRDIEVAMVKEHYVIPIYLVRNNLAYHKHIDVGSQPVTDGIVHLWEVTGGSN